MTDYIDKLWKSVGAAIGGSAPSTDIMGKTIKRNADEARADSLGNWGAVKSYDDAGNETGTYRDGAKTSW